MQRPFLSHFPDYVRRISGELFAAENFSVAGEEFVELFDSEPLALAFRLKPTVVFAQLAVYGVFAVFAHADAIMRGGGF